MSHELGKLPNCPGLACKKPGTERAPESLLRKVHAALASRLSKSRIIATSMSDSLVCTFRS
jgi:hypothetical protein